MKVGEVYRHKHSNVDRKFYITDVVLVHPHKGNEQFVFLDYGTKESILGILNAWQVKWEDFFVVRVMSKEEMLTSPWEALRQAAALCE